MNADDEQNEPDFDPPTQWMQPPGWAVEEAVDQLTRNGMLPEPPWDDVARRAWELVNADEDAERRRLDGDDDQDDDQQRS